MTWIPATDMRGAGLFLRSDESHLTKWENGLATDDCHESFQAARGVWRAGFKPSAESGADTDPGLLRSFLLHSFSHAFMRQPALDSGYAMASITKRIVALPATDLVEPMAGIAIYTAATDSEGTLGRLVRLGGYDQLSELLTAALTGVQLCASDPLCAEHTPNVEDGPELHGATCHPCIFAPETFCEMGNLWLDRATLVETFTDNGISFFGSNR